MKYTNKLWAFAAVLGLLLGTACGSDDTPEPGEEDMLGQEISGTWIIEEPTDVTGPVADQFSAFSITITATASEVRYTASGNEEKLVFPDAGTFAVDASDNFTSGADVVRGPDNVNTRMTLTEGGNVLTMSFTIDTGINAHNGRVMAIEGDYTFTLQRQQAQQQ